MKPGDKVRLLQEMDLGLKDKLQPGRWGIVRLVNENTCTVHLCGIGEGEYSKLIWEVIPDA